MTTYEPIKKEDLEKRINQAKDASLENRTLMTILSMKSYAASLCRFGLRSETTRDALRVRKEFVQIIKEEKAIFKFMLEHLNLFNLEAASDLIDKLDELNDQTINYYNDVLKDIDHAVIAKDEKQAKRPVKTFETLTDTKSYREEVMGLVESTESIKEFLGYPEEFWNYLENKCSTVDMSHEVADGMPIVMPIFDKDENVADMRVICPEPRDLYTALIAIQTYVKAYEVYQSLGHRFVLHDDHQLERMKLHYKQGLQEKAKRSIK